MADYNEETPESIDDNVEGESEDSIGSVPAGEMSKEERTWGMACHLAALAMLVGIPFGNIVGPLVVWLVKRAEFPFVDNQAKESLNFQISMTIYMIAALIITCPLGGIGIFVVAIVDIVFIVLASVQANSGEPYRYPITIRFIK